jgi:gliding motility-associated-like protein
MKKIFLTLILMLSYISLAQQTQIWNDDFNNPGDWDLTVQTGLNESNANFWAISDDEGGVAPPNCGVSGNGDPTLHVTCTGMTCIGTGAVYYSGDAGMAGFPSTTNLRAALINPASTLGETGLELVFDYTGVGQASADFAELEYSIDGGATWTVLWTQTPSNICAGGIGEWAEVTVPLPVAAENQNDLRFAFNWTNDNDANGSNPSFAVNNLRLFASASSSSLNADFSISAITICEGDCVSFNDLSTTGTTINSWDWTFNGSTTSSSASQNPTNICYPVAGTYNVTLEVSDNTTSDQVTQTITVISCPGPPPVAAFSADTMLVCQFDCISFTDESTNNPTSWQWSFEGATPDTSNIQNPRNICFDTVGTYDVTLIVSNDGGTDQITNTIVVQELPVIEAFGDTTIDLRGAALLEAFAMNEEDIFWVPGDDIVCDTVTCNRVFASPFETTTYFPSVVGDNGCIGSDTVVVTVNFEDVVSVPSAFSPNEDGRNDVLHVLGLGIVSIDFKIYNRYGQLVYQTTDLEEGWDGSFGGERLNPGVFVYTVDYTLIDGSSGEISGNVTLLK